MLLVKMFAHKIVGNGRTHEQELATSMNKLRTDKLHMDLQPWGWFLLLCVGAHWCQSEGPACETLAGGGCGQEPRRPVEEWVNGIVGQLYTNSKGEVREGGAKPQSRECLHQMGLVEPNTDCEPVFDFFLYCKTTSYDYIIYNVHLHFTNYIL